MAVERPIFIVSAGRSGSSLLHQIMARDPQLMWISNVLNKWPSQLLLNRMATGLYQKGWGLNKLKPDESYRFWDTLFRGFKRPMRDLTGDDLPESAKKKIRHVLDKLNPSGKRLMIKITGYSRIGFIRAIYPDALFIHIIRDGRAVAHSLLKVGFWEGWKGPHQWNLGPLDKMEQAIFEESQYSFAALAGIYWNKCVDSVDQSIRENQLEILEIKYTDLCQDPVETMQAIYDYCDLDWSKALQRRVASMSIENQNFKWLTDLSDAEIARIEKICKKNNERHGLGD